MAALLLALLGAAPAAAAVRNDDVLGRPILLGRRQDGSGRQAVALPPPKLDARRYGTIAWRP
jgi:hypothetical protein